MLLQYKYRYFSILSLILISLIASSCSLKPIYGKNESSIRIADDLAAITVIQPEINRSSAESNDKRTQQILKNALEDALNPTSNNIDKKYELKFSFTKEVNPLSIEQDAEITLYNIIATVDFSLIDLSNNTVVYQDTSTITSSYKTVTSDFANYTVEEDTLLRALKESAQDVRISIASYFLSK